MILLFLVQYAHDNNLTNTNGWKLAKKYKKLINKYFKFITRVNAMKAQKDRARNKHKFGIQVPDNPRHAYILDKLW